MGWMNSHGSKMGYKPVKSIDQGTYDFHFENIIDYGEYPLLIDMETLFSNQVDIGSDDS